MPPPNSDSRDEALPLTPAFYSISEDEYSFFTLLIGPHTDEELKTHILAIQQEAYNVYPYPCIRRFDFLRLKISKHPMYAKFIASAQLPNALFLDLGCCFGNDIRKAVTDGYPIANIIGCDLRQEFWNLGYKLFKQSHSDFPVPFYCGDIFDDGFLSPGDATSDNMGDSMTPSLSALKRGVTAIHVAAFFHLFTEDQQSSLAHRLAALLSPQKGSMIFGSHVARPIKGMRVEAAGLGSLGAHMFCHSDKSFARLWDGEVFPRGSVQVEARLEVMERNDLRPKDGLINHQLIWCVTRL